MGNQSINISIPENYRLDGEVKKSIHESLPYFVPDFVDADFEERSLVITCRQSDESEKQIVENVLALVKKTVTSFRDVSDEILYSSPHESTLISTDPFEHLVKSRSVVSTGRGKFIYAKEVLDVFEAFDSKVLEYCVSQGAEKDLYPTTIKTSSLIESGYLKLSPQLAYFVAPAHLDNQCLLKIGSSDILNPDNREKVTSNLGVPDQVMAPTVCYHCFEARKGEKIETGFITALNKCHRHEPVNVTSLERLTTYWMRELIRFGSEEEVQNCLNDSLAWTTDLLDTWGANYTVTSASDPFFADMGSGNRLFQAAFKLKRELRMPVFSGKDIAVASYNFHQKTLVDKFGISSELDDTLSGCVGWGYERFIYSLFCQFGASISDWPIIIKKSLNL